MKYDASTKSCPDNDARAQRQGPAVPTVSGVNAQFDRMFRPESARPVNPAPLLTTKRL